jgi:uncharacterized protein
VLVSFLYELRRRKIPVGTHEAIALAQALARGLHESSLDGFYFTARALLVHSERHLDDFDLAFAAHFRGARADAEQLAERLLEWLSDPRTLAELGEIGREAIERLELDELRRRFEQRSREQRERHDGGNRWIGTGGTSPFGRGGRHPTGMSMGGGSGQPSALSTADARLYRPYRSDRVLDVRQIEVALRKLRALAREGRASELDVEGTIDRTGRNAGELEVVMRPPRRANTRVILMMDVGGSMDPHVELMSRLFSAAKRATHFRELRTYYFHNCVYGTVYRTEELERPLSVGELVRECGRHYKLVMVGDAAMASYELLGASGADDDDDARASGIACLGALRNHFERSVWLNPDPEIGWNHFTVNAIRNVFPMFPLTLDGLGEAVRELVGTRGRSHGSPR